jgi:hypothetical protein
MPSTFITLILAALAAFAGWKLKPEKEPPPISPPVVSVQEMGTLTTLRMNYSNVIEFNEPLARDIPWTQWELRLGGSKVLLVARGDCFLGTDLKLAKYEQINSVEKTAMLHLPAPKVLSARLNHDPKSGGSYFYAITTSGVATLVPGTDGQRRAVNKALEKGQREIETACASPELIAAAKSSAESVLQPTVSATGWKIKTVWR